MKSIVNRVVAFLVIGTLTGVLVSGKTTEKKVTFIQSVSVNGTEIKKGTYKVTFNDETGELAIKKGGKVLATAQARVEKTTGRNSFYTHSASDDPTKAPALVSVSLKDGNLATIVNSGDNKGMSVRPRP
jgi:hypothetical protein